METLTKKNPIKKILEDKAPFGFIPSSEFYSKINVKRKMWAMFIRGEQEPSISQFKAICEHFNVEPANYL